MWVLLAGEGANDIGRSDIYDSEEGWVQPICRNISLKDLEFRTVNSKKLAALPRKHRPYPAGHGRKALAAAIKARVEGFDALVFMADLDSTSNKEWKKRNEQIKDGLGKGGTPAVSCLPKSVSESWLLSDKQAWKKMGLSDVSFLPGSPEDAWGDKKDPDSGHPKNVFKRVAESLGLSANTSLRCHIAEISDPDNLDKKCPISYRNFRNDFIENIG